MELAPSAKKYIIVAEMAAHAVGWDPRSELPRVAADTP